MSVRLKTHAGIFVRCLSSIVTKDVGFRGCTNAACSRHELAAATDAFCGACGLPITHITRKAKRAAVSPVDIEDQFNDRLMVKDSKRNQGAKVLHIWYPNVPYKGSYRMPDLNENEVDVDLSNINFETEKAQFELHFKKELAVLRESYGETAVQVCWGIYSYWY